MRDTLSNLCVTLVASGIGCCIGAAADSPYQNWLMYSGGALILSAVIGMTSSFLISVADDKGTDRMTGDRYSNSGSNFGHMGPVNNYGKPDFLLTESMLISIIAECPAGIPVTVIAVGPRSARRIQTSVADALIGRGFHVSRGSIGVLLPAPEHPVEIEKTPSQTVITIAPEA